MTGTASRAEAALLEYLDEHLGSQPAAGAAPSLVAFRVGPFRFLLPGADAGGPTGDETCRIAGADLVPPQFRAHLEAGGAGPGPDTVVLCGRRFAIAGCLCEGRQPLAEGAMQPRGPRTEAPWIAGTASDPPAFVLDPIALELHFRRRAEAGG